MTIQVYRDSTLITLTPEEEAAHLAELAANAAASATPLDERIKLEASRRINIILKDATTQRNLTALGVKLGRAEAKGTATPNDLAILDVLDATQVWVMQVLAKGRELTTALDGTFLDDVHWPAPPAGIVSIVAAL